jgi:hypothetical protein
MQKSKFKFLYLRKYPRPQAPQVFVKSTLHSTFGMGNIQRHFKFEMQFVWNALGQEFF